ncbi:Complex1LYR-like protein [Aspergillus parasiticus SU-1]|uniref:Mitochondrial zinc maintenance protein 1, mitochondrial n=2 Tax=Aspergillus subgen. Circumdati TaxID=2720871 RepID=A0A0F0I361_ASPPU|nr:mitochondrial zinc maintenance protein 1, mitochondrial [Aspergillus transmontanensis]KJK61062.1 Complex1LYR-like protein [Aspergillus parasiticus SU-1]
MTAPALSARGAYRQILRATRIAFHEDTRVLLAARQEARRQFDEHKRVGIDTPMQINHAIEVASILKHNIVQGVKPEGDEAAKWELRIHDDIERGDNDSIKHAGQNIKIHKACSA